MCSSICAKRLTASGSGQRRICGCQTAKMKDILHGPALRTGRKMPRALRRTAKSFLRWRCFLHRTGGATARGFSIIPMRQRRYCARVSIREITVEPVHRCGTGKITRFYLCRGAASQTRRIICRIFMSYLRSGHMRRTDLSGHGRRLRAAGILRLPVIRRQGFRQSTLNLTEAR